MENNKELIAIGSAFIMIVGLAMYMFVAQQKNNNMVKESIEVKALIEKVSEDMNTNKLEIKSAIDSLNIRMDQTDEKYHSH